MGSPFSFSGSPENLKASRVKCRVQLCPGVQESQGEVALPAVHQAPWERTPQPTPAQHQIPGTDPPVRGQHETAPIVPRESPQSWAMARVQVGPASWPSMGVAAHWSSEKPRACGSWCMSGLGSRGCPPVRGQGTLVLHSSPLQVQGPQALGTPPLHALPTVYHRLAQASRPSSHRESHPPHLLMLAHTSQVPFWKSPP